VVSVATAVRQAVSAVVDPEIRVVTVEELGILRGVEVDADGRATVTISPTYAGCPAMDVIRSDVTAAATAAGATGVDVVTVLAPAWSTDMISPSGRERLAAAGIAPPGPVARPGVVALRLSVRCPRCGSPATEELSRFGSTACKSLWRCTACGEPFDHIKAHLTVRRMVDGEDVRRSYSICSTPADLLERGRLCIGVKHLAGGSFSEYVVSELTTGATVDVMPPLGHFTTAFTADRSRRYAAVAAGSGITPVLSILATGLATEPDSEFTLVYGNRFARSVMFAEELADLKDRYPTRLHVIHVLSREPQDAALLSGRVDAERFERLIAADGLIDADSIDEWFLCGPYGMVVDVRGVLSARGVADGRVHAELFHVADSATPPPALPAADARPTAGDAEVTIVLDGRASRLTMRRDERVLDAALRVRSELPFACRGGVCSTCKAKVTEGAVTMARNYALEPDEIAAGYVLTCQSSPVTDTITVDYDA
jgi:ring-1,2-phenylacetyl-CoA epoxidase subunit PaaE